MATSRIREVQEQLLAVRNRKLALGDDIRTMAPKEHLSPEAEARFDRKIETYKKLEVEEIDLDRELVGLVRTDKSLTLEPGDQSSGSPQFMRSGPDPWTEHAARSTASAISARVRYEPTNASKASTSPTRTVPASSG